MTASPRAGAHSALHRQRDGVYSSMPALTKTPVPRMSATTQSPPISGRRKIRSTPSTCTIRRPSTSTSTSPRAAKRSTGSRPLAAGQRPSKAPPWRRSRPGLRSLRSRSRSQRIPPARNSFLSLAPLGSSVLGQFSTVGGIGYGDFSPSASGWYVNRNWFPAAPASPRSSASIGHGLGLAHPHDNGGGSEIMEGVLHEFGSFGTYLMDQGVFTVMSYNDGWSLKPDGGVVTATAGNEGTPGPLDIALVQINTAQTPPPMRAIQLTPSPPLRAPIRRFGTQAALTPFRSRGRLRPPSICAQRRFKTKLAAAALYRASAASKAASRSPMAW